MRVFVTGATGFIGSATVSELLGAGHQVLGLARSPQAADALRAAGADVHRGALDDLTALRGGAREADGVIHLAFTNISATTDFAESCRVDREAVTALGEALEGSGRPLVVTSGLLLEPGRVGTENDAPADNPFARLRGASEAVTLAFADRGVRAIVLRLAASVHSENDRGFVPHLIALARANGYAAYPGDGSMRWTAVHRRDAARLYRLAVESAPAGTRLHGVGESAVSLRTIAEAIARELGADAVSVPIDQVPEYFGWLSHFVTRDVPAASDLTRELLGWTPEHRGLIEDLEQGDYFGRTEPEVFRPVRHAMALRHADITC